MPVAVYGLGKMGLPLATAFAGAFGQVIGVDIDTETVETIARGESPVRGEPGLDEELEASVSEGRLRVSDDPTASADTARVHVVIVPTLLDNRDGADLSALESTVQYLGDGLDTGDMVIIESTVPPGTCRDLVQPRLQTRAGLPGAEFGLAFCPERTASGRALRDIRGAYPKVVGGRDAESTRVASLIYSELTDNEVVPVSDPTTAECVKLFEGVYRDVNIALANELARLGGEFGVDVREAIDVANGTDYCHIHQPGPGVGGHCIPVYPYFVMNATDDETPLLQTARNVNEAMPDHTVDILESQLAENGVDLGDANVALLGVTYRAGVDETRNSPAFPIASTLSDAGAEVFAADPVCSDMGELAARAVTIDVLPALDLDALVVVTAYDEFATIAWEKLDDVVIIDGRGGLDSEAIPHDVQTLGDGTTGRDQPTELTNE